METLHHRKRTHRLYISSFSQQYLTIRNPIFRTTQLFGLFANRRVRYQLETASIRVQRLTLLYRKLLYFSHRILTCTKMVVLYTKPL